ncbi:MAG: flagellar biosynthesis protein FlhA [Bryobacteraceae bacterium]
MGRLRNTFQFLNVAELGVPVAVLMILVALIVPVPGWLLDLLIVIDIMTSLVVMMVSVYITRPVDFSVFPTTLLLLTLLRLSLNISATRLILSNGNTGTSAAGSIIEAFGNFVVGGSFVIGVIIFLTLIAIQYVVINHGAVRISEVTARFTLDSLPGKQMSIDSDLSSGIINEKEARERRKMLSSESDFYGAMDGATRFTQRDAIASILITGINIAGGFLIGVFQHGMPLVKALETYTVLTIGDGLVTVIPALMVSISGGLIVTRASSEERLSAHFVRQFFSNGMPLMLAAGMILTLAIIPGLPKIPFLLVGGVAGTIGWRIEERKKRTAETPKPATATEVKENLEGLLKVDPLAVALGIGLVKMIQAGPDAPILKRLNGIRKQLVLGLGFFLPPVRFIDGANLRHREYAILIRGNEVARYEMAAGCDLAVPNEENVPKIAGTPTREPSFGMPAVWTPAANSMQARNSGYTVVDQVSVMGTHLMEVVRAHAHELFGLQEMKKLLDLVAAEHPKVVEEVVPKLLSLAVVHRVFQNLLRERISIRDAVTILEAAGEASLTTKNVVLITEYARQAIRRSIVQPFLDREEKLRAYVLDTALDEAVVNSVQHGEITSHLSLAPSLVREFIKKIEDKVGNPAAPVAILVSAGARYFLQQLAETALKNVFFLSHSDVPPTTQVVSVGLIR